jgi:hypothetical protein
MITGDDEREYDDLDWEAVRDDQEVQHFEKHLKDSGLIDSALEELVKKAVTKLARAGGAKTGAKNSLKHQERVKLILEAAALLKAKNARLSNMALGTYLEKKDKKIFGSANTIRKILGEHAAK